MFWRFGGYANISTIDTLLDKPDVTLEELLDESDLIQELNLSAAKTIFDVKSASSETTPLPDLVREFAPLIAHEE